MGPLPFVGQAEPNFLARRRFSRTRSKSDVRPQARLLTRKPSSHPLFHSRQTTVSYEDPPFLLFKLQMAAATSQALFTNPAASRLPPSHFAAANPAPSSVSVSAPLPKRRSLVARLQCSRQVKVLSALGDARVASEIKDSAVAAKELGPIVVIDNYDSFTFNLCQYMGELGADFEVYRNDEITVEEMRKKNPRGILISPGPGTPQDSGISLETVLKLGPSIPLFGVCMGLQCMGEAFGGKIVRSPYGVMHGKSSLVYYDEKGDDGLFAGLPNPFTAGRYHSLVIDKDSFPGDALEVTAWTEDGLIMAARHKIYRHIQGVQFHPESIITSEGKTMVQNFIKLVEKKAAQSQES